MLEVVSALRRVVSSGEAPALRAEQAIEDLLELPITRHPQDHSSRGCGSYATP